MFTKISVFVICVFLSSQVFAESIFTSTADITVTGLTADQFIEAPLPKDKCTTWVRLKTHNTIIPEVLIVHVSDRGYGYKPYILVGSQIKDQSIFRDEVWKIQKWWDINQEVKVIDRGDDIVATLHFKISPDTRYYGATYKTAFEAQFNSVFMLHYRDSATFEQHCSEIPKWIVDAYPYKNNIKK